MASTVIASNTSAVYFKTQTTVGTAVLASAIVAGDAIRVVGAPKFSPRGAGIIERTDTMTPFGGGQAVVTGGHGWDITFQTELFWNGAVAGGTGGFDNTQLAALWRATPFTVTPATPDVTLAVQSQFATAGSASRSPAYAVQPFTMFYVESSGKRYAAFDCIAIPKISAEYGQRVMIDWTVKGKWIDPDAYNDTATIPAPDYPAAQPPIVAVNCALTLAGYFDSVTALTKWTFDPGFALSDVGDSREANGFAIGFSTLATYPSLEVDVADLPEGPSYTGAPPGTPSGEQPDWTKALSNEVFGSALTLAITVATGDTITFSLANPQVIAWPAVGDTDGHRSLTLKFGAIPDATTPSPATIIFNATI
jgi:hypothetical protein